VYAVVICALAAGSIAFATVSKRVTLVVDGAERTISTYAVGVGAVMAEADVAAGPNDLVAPAATSKVKDGSTVVVVHARPVTIKVDGTTHTQWVAALTVDEALSQLGYDPAQVFTRASRSKRLPVGGATLSILTAKKFTVIVDGKSMQLQSAGPTVKDALVDSGVTLGAHDRLSVPATAALRAGLTVTVTRVKVTAVTEARAVPFAVVSTSDPTAYVGIDTVVTTGSPGKALVTVEVMTVEGGQTLRKDVSTTVVLAPVTRLVKSGSKQFPAEVDALNWYALATCESTNNPAAVSASGTYSGAYQFSVPTWQSVGGTGVAKDASPEEQLARAKMLYMRSGAGQWECGSQLY
jgi:uncharacterized protein YabE (DUF348 family)